MYWRNAVLLGLALTFGPAPKAQAADTFELPAVQSAYIHPDGPQKGANAERYLNVEGKNTGKYACFGVLRFDAKSLKGDLEAKYGARKYKISGLSLELMQSNASFSKDGSVLVYLTQSASVDVSTLKYPYNPKDGAIRGEQIATGKYARRADSGRNAGTRGDDDDAKDISRSGGTKLPKPPVRDDNVVVSASATPDTIDLFNGAAGKALVIAITQGKAVILVLGEGDPTVAATWAGQKPASPRKAPTLILKVTAGS